jgi:hypothetical protein
MKAYHYFRSESRPALRAFADDRSGARLPAESGPWRFVRAIDPSEGWTGAVDRSAVEAGVTVNGFYLVESEAELAFDESPARARDFP